MKYLAITNLIEERLREVSESIENRYGKETKEISLKVLSNFKTGFSYYSPRYYKRLLLMSGYCDALFVPADDTNYNLSYSKRGVHLNDFSQRVKELASRKNDMYSYEKTPAINRLINILVNGNPNFNKDRFQYRRHNTPKAKGASGNIKSRINLKFPYEMSIRWIPEQEDNFIEMLNENTLNKCILNMYPIFVSNELIMHSCADNITKMLDNDLDLDELKNFEELRKETGIFALDRIPVEKNLDSNHPFRSLVDSI